jgi:hypothetical protein
MPCTGHSHDHEHAEEVSTNLREYIDIAGVTCLNESIPGSVKSVFKEPSARLTRHPSVMSPPDEADDQELLIHVPFTEAVTITSLCIRGPAPSIQEATSTDFQSACPHYVKLFTNRDDIDFSMAEELPSAMDLEVVHPDHEAEEGTASIDYSLKNRGKFQSISSITLFVKDNWGIEDDSDEFSTEVSEEQSLHRCIRNAAGGSAILCSFYLASWCPSLILLLFFQTRSKTKRRYHILGLRERE